MDINWHSILTSHFLWGLVIGLLIWLYTLLKCTFTARKAVKAKESVITALNNEKHKLRQHLQIQLDIEAESKSNQKKALEQLKDENENLRVTVQTLRQKPKREDIILLQVYDRAIHIMQERAPGFAPTWEGTLKEAKGEIEKANRGILPFIRRVIRPSSTPMIVTDDSKKRLETSE